MKMKFLSLAFLFAVTVQIASSQCSRSGFFVQSDPTYNISGSANITFGIDGSKNIIFDSNFVTVQGVDLRVYLSTADDILAPGAETIEVTASQLLNDDGGTSPPQAPITGMMEFPIDTVLYPNIQIDDFDFIVIQCIAINERWGYVSLEAAEGADCSPSSIDENLLLESIKFYPNPVIDNIEIFNDKLFDLEISILDFLGKELLQTNNTSQSTQTIDLSDLRSGIYFLRVENGANVLVKKFVKQ